MVVEKGSREAHTSIAPRKNVQQLDIQQVDWEQQNMQ